MFTYTFEVGLEKIDYKALNAKVATDVIAEIKKMIASGKNTDGLALLPKIDGSTPTFIDTGLMLNSITSTASDVGFNIFVDGQRAIVMDYLNSKNNWTIFQESTIIDEFATKKYDEYLQAELDKI